MTVHSQKMERFEKEDTLLRFMQKERVVKLALLRWTTYYFQASYKMVHRMF